MKRKQLLIGVVIGLIVAAGLAGGVAYWRRCCGRGPRMPSYVPKPLTDLQVAEAWLTCIDCQGPFMLRLRDMPAGNRDTVVKFLHDALVNGPGGSRSDRLIQDLERAWRADSISRLRRGEKPDTGFSSFVSRYRDGFETRWRARAAVALGVIRTPAAMAALQAGAQLPQLDHGDSVLHRVVTQAKDSGLVALGHYVP
jgi:hypothetical protein